ncbi:MAG: MlaD family protein [Acidobacteriota bacterium]
MSQASEVRTGLFVILALIILVVGSLWIVGVNPLAGAGARYEVAMKGAGGVRPGEEVRLSGFKVGRVDDVELEVGAEWPVTFAVTLDAELSLTEDASARFASDGLLGSSYLEIVAGDPSAAKLPVGGRIYGTSSGGLSDLMAGLDEVMGRVDRLLEEGTELFQSLSTEVGPTLDRVQVLLAEENLEAVTETLASSRRTVAQLESSLPPLIARLDGLATMADQSLQGAPGLVSDARGLVADVQQALGEDGERLTKVLDNAASALDSAEQTLGIVGDRETDIETALRNLREASMNLKAFSQAIRARPSSLLRAPRTPDRKPGEGLR